MEEENENRAYEITCPMCKTTSTRNPNLKLMISTCGHSLCDSCVTLRFGTKSATSSARCPAPSCGLPLRFTSFHVQMFDDAGVEKEVDVRRKILKDFNKKESDFATLKEYNDYLEEVETIIFNLSNGIDVVETEERVKAYKRENLDGIRKNKSKLSTDELLVEQLLAEERELLSANQKTHAEEVEQGKQRQRQRDQLIDDLTCSELPANRIVEKHRSVVAASAPQQQRQPDAVPQPRITTFSSGIPLLASSQETYVPWNNVETTEKLYQYTPLELDTMGPKPPSTMEIISNDYLVNIRSATAPETAGGYQSHIACERALLDAFCGLQFDSSAVGDGNAMATNG